MAMQLAQRALTLAKVAITASLGLFALLAVICRTT